MKTLYISLALVAGLGSNLAAQIHTDNSGSSSVSYFSESKSDADGGQAQSTTYRVTAAIGQIDPGVRTSATYRLDGGFAGTLGVTATGPWLTSAAPHFVTPRTTNLVWLSGTRLNVGVTTVTVSTKPATVVAKSATDMAIRMPALPTPGWHEIKLTNSSGTTSLERGIGVLPMMFTEGAAASNSPFDLVFKGSKGDSVVWALGFGPGPVIPLGNYLHGLTINTSFVRILPTLAITANSGEFRLPVPPVPFVFTIYSQGLFLSANPGYSPGSFSNMVSF